MKTGPGSAPACGFGLAPGPGRATEAGARAIMDCRPASACPLASPLVRGGRRHRHVAGRGLAFATMPEGGRCDPGLVYIVRISAYDVYRTLEQVCTKTDAVDVSITRERRPGV